MDGYVFSIVINIPLKLMEDSRLSGGIRRFAFQKLAALAVETPAELSHLAEQSRPDDALNGILKDQAPTARVPMVY
jgi:phosphatidylinositol 4-kinase